MIPLIIAVFLVIFFLVTIVFSVKTWRATQVTAVVLTFLASLSLVVTASLSYKTHSTWKKKYAETEQQLKQANATGQQLAYGDAQQVPWGEGSVADLQAELSQLLVDRGRAWRHCPPSAPTGNTITIGTVAPDTPPEEAKPNGITEGTVVYAFKEQPETGYPLIYLGEYRVTQAEDQSVTLQPTTPLDPFQEQHFLEPNSTWTLYEIMPIDKHAAFAAEPRTEPLLDDQPQPLFGHFDEALLRNTFAAVSGDPADSPRISQLVANYLRDGAPVDEQTVRQFPENTWLKLEFEKEHTVRVDSNNPDVGLSGIYFDPEGYAVSANLRQDGEVTFRENDIAVLPYSHEEDRKYVDNLIASGICRTLQPYFVRDLRDYENALHNVRNRYVRSMKATRRATRDIQALNKAKELAEEQTAFRQSEQVDLESDLEKFNFEKQQITKLAGALDEQQDALQDKLRDLFRTNLALNEKLSVVDQELTEDINRRTAEAAAQVE